MILDARDDLEVVGEAENGEQAVQLALERDPDVVLMDVRMPSLDGVAATRQIVAAGVAATRDRVDDVRCTPSTPAPHGAMRCYAAVGLAPGTPIDVPLP